MDAPQLDVPIVPALLIGGGIGLLSGLTGTGGGIFLSPVLLLLGWARTRKTAEVSAAFILLNSIAALAGPTGAREAEKPKLAGRVEVDDAYLGGERPGGKRGRGAAGKTPIVAAVETTAERRPRRCG